MAESVRAPARTAAPIPASVGVAAARRKAPTSVVALALALTAWGLPPEAAAQEPSTPEPPPVGREAAEALVHPPLEFHPPDARRYEVDGVPVLFLEDHSRPLVDFFARFRGGYGLFERDRYAAATALPALLRNGGTGTLSADSVDILSEHYALSTTFGSGGQSSSATLNTLTRTLDPALELWADILRNPRFDPERIEVWRGRELERVRRRADDPGGLAVTEFNRIMYGDHSVGWEMAPRDLTRDRVNAQVLRRLHGEIFCKEHMILGVTGDITWQEARPRLRRLLEGWPACPRELPEPDDPRIRDERRIFLIPRPGLAQSVIVLAQPGGISREHPDYFASRIANQILGGSGFSSRIMARVRTEEGYAYSASSFWTAPRDHQGVVGALTRTRPEATVAATRLLLDIFREARASPPSGEEVATRIQELANGFVFNFENPAQIVSRQIFYLAVGLPEDWLSRFLEETRAVTVPDVARVWRENLRPEDMTILIVGDPEAFGESLGDLGAVTVWEPEVMEEPPPD